MFLMTTFSFDDSCFLFWTLFTGEQILPWSVFLNAGYTTAQLRPSSAELVLQAVLRLELQDVLHPCSLPWGSWPEGWAVWELLCEQLFLSGFVELAVLVLVTGECCSCRAGSWPGPGHPALQNVLCHCVTLGCFSASLNWGTGSIPV